MEANPIRWSRAILLSFGCHYLQDSLARPVAWVYNQTLFQKSARNLPIAALPTLSSKVKIDCPVELVPEAILIIGSTDLEEILVWKGWVKKDPVFQIAAIALEGRDVISVERDGPVTSHHGYAVDQPTEFF